MALPKAISSIAAMRLQNERLIGAKLERPDEVVRWLGAVQAQDYAGAKWAVAQRTAACRDDAVERAFAAGEILRLHVLRPTWHFVAPQDVRSLLLLSAKAVHRLNAYYYRQVGLDAVTLRRSADVITRALEGQHYLTRAELAERLERAGIAEAAGMRLGYIAMHAELEGLICSGPRRGKQHTYALLDERAPTQARLPSRDEALADLTVRYFESHGPALPRDFSWWSGLSLAEVKVGLALAADRLRSEQIGEHVYYLATERAPLRWKRPSVQLLPNYDEFLVAFKDTRVSYDPELFEGIDARGTLLAAHIVVLDGQIIGGWRRELTKNAVTLTVTLAGRLQPDQRAALAREVERYALCLGVEAELTVQTAARRKRAAAR